MFLNIRIGFLMWTREDLPKILKKCCVGRFLPHLPSLKIHWKAALYRLNLVLIECIFSLCFSAQKMEVLRQDVEEIEKEMEELRAYLAKTDEKREEAEDTVDNMDYQEEGKKPFLEIESRWSCFHLITFPYLEFPLRPFPTTLQSSQSDDCRSIEK